MKKDEIKIGTYFKISKTPDTLFEPVKGILEKIENKVIFQIKNTGGFDRGSHELIYCDVFKCDDKKLVSELEHWLMVDDPFFKSDGLFGLIMLPAEPDVYQYWEIVNPNIDFSKYPHICTICGSPAYISGSNSIDCSSCNGTY